MNFLKKTITSLGEKYENIKKDIIVLEDTKAPRDSQNSSSVKVDPRQLAQSYTNPLLDSPKIQFSASNTGEFAHSDI